MIQNSDFDQIRPYTDAEVHHVIEGLCKEPYFIRMIPALIPGVPVDNVVAKLKTINSKEEFQVEFIIPFLNGLIKNTTAGVTMSGLENIEKDGSYLFITNHRDIILDSAFLNVKLHENGFKTTEIGIGDNLLIYNWITDIVKLNKSFVVKRGLPVRQQMEASAQLSSFIRYSINSLEQNIWLAQREGRSKDGNDQTQGSVLKMLNLSGEGQLVDNFKQLNIVPVSISYEFDPCDYLKAYQYQLKRDDPEYKKTKDEDLSHMNMGLFGRKGHVHFSVGTPIHAELDAIAGLAKNEQITAITELIDRQIHHNYHLWPGNYVAYDMLEKSDKFADKYTAEEKKEFVDYVNEHVSRLTNPDVEFVMGKILGMYANPVYNQLKTE